MNGLNKNRSRVLGRPDFEISPILVPMTLCFPTLSHSTSSSHLKSVIFLKNVIRGGDLTDILAQGCQIGFLSNANSNVLESIA